uniref:zinc finger protein 195 n=1 Tax=Macaca mulatta TaxID=9544 RepID=UPI0010A27580|nr:zinc finger protein 195 [Macaca mulatta]
MSLATVDTLYMFSHDTQGLLRKKCIEASFQKLILDRYGSCGPQNLHLRKEWESKGHRQGHEPKLQKDCLTLEKKPKASDTVHISEMRRPMMPAVRDPQRPTPGTASDPDLSLKRPPTATSEKPGDLSAHSI